MLTCSSHIPPGTVGDGLSDHGHQVTAGPALFSSAGPCQPHHNGPRRAQLPPSARWKWNIAVCRGKLSGKTPGPRTLHRCGPAPLSSRLQLNRGPRGPPEKEGEPSLFNGVQATVGQCALRPVSKDSSKGQFPQKAKLWVVRLVTSSAWTES